ncbi:MAG: SnoaL-like domain-containing protein [Spirosomataceae bacterium]
MTTLQISERFNELAQQEKWFEIQDELFSDDVISVEPAHSPYLKNAKGKEFVRKKGEEWVGKITALYGAYTTAPVVAGNHFSIGRGFDVEVNGIGRVTIDEIIVYEVKDGKIISEQFFY